MSSPILDLKPFNERERTVLLGFAAFLRNRKDARTAKDEALGWWDQYAMLPPAVADEQEADRIALEAVREARAAA